jgi:methenyltetrahydrofolate cyclohydrolase
MLIDQTVSAFTDELASNSPAPGGGSIAALAGALGAALTSMVCRLTVGKKKYADVREEMESVLARAEDYRASLTALIDRDTEAFTRVMDAFGLPKESDEEKRARSEAIQHAMKEAVRVPLEVMHVCAELAALTSVVEEKGNANSVTDAGVGALMIEAASRGAAFNVKINLGSITDKEFCAEISAAVAQYEASTARTTGDVIASVEKKLQPSA